MKTNLNVGGADHKYRQGTNVEWSVAKMSWKRVTSGIWLASVGSHQGTTVTLTGNWCCEEKQYRSHPDNTTLNNTLLLTLRKEMAQVGKREGWNGRRGISGLLLWPTAFIQTTVWNVNHVSEGKARRVVDEGLEKGWVLEERIPILFCRWGPDLVNLRLLLGVHAFMSRQGSVGGSHITTGGVSEMYPCGGRQSW